MKKWNRYRHSLKDKNALGNILQQMKDYKHAARPDMQKFITQVEAIYNSFENTDKDDTLCGYRKEMEEKLK